MEGFNLSKDVENKLREDLARFDGRDMKRILRETLPSPGDAVGLAASMSLITPITQSALDSKHGLKGISFGNESKTSRANSLTSNSYKPETTIYTIRFENETADNVLSLVKDFEYRRVSDFVSGVRRVTKLPDWYPLWMSTRMESAIDASTHVLTEVIFDDEKLYEYDLLLIDVYESAKECLGTKFSYAVSPSVERSMIFARPVEDDSESETTEILISQILFKHRICGMEGISKAVLSYDGTFFLRALGRDCKNRGNTYAEILSSRGVDTSRTACNNIDEIYKTYGIESARSALIEEFSSLANKTEGSYHDDVVIFVDCMTREGQVAKVGISGMKEINTLISLLSFERVRDTLKQGGTITEAGSKGTTVDNIFCGRNVRVGTGYFECI